MKFLIALCILTAPLLSANPGQEIYQTLCAACHGTGGKGVGEGANRFPPLAKSDWVKGDPRRIIQVVLGGLQGPVSVNGEDYNLVMPPHGSSMTDQQITDVVSYVRQNLGNQEGPVTLAMVKTQRAQKDNPALPAMWTAEKLLKKYPLAFPQQKLRIQDLLSYIHHGKFKKLAQLRASEAKNVEEEKGGLISVKHADRKEHFGLVWTGWLDAPQKGKYTFSYDTDDGGAVSLNGKEIITRDRIGGAGKPTQKSVQLKQGRNEIKIEYFEFTGHENVALSWSGPGVRNVSLSEQKVKQKAKTPVIMLKAPEGEATIYRNFIKGTDPRGIGVGYGEGVNLAFSADSMSLDLLWRGDFIDAGRHWTGRGQGDQEPSGEGHVMLNQGFAFARLSDPKVSWSDGRNDLKPTFKGYVLDRAQHPTFAYSFSGVQVQDHPQPEADGNSLMRTLTFTVSPSSEPLRDLYFRALSGSTVKIREDGRFQFKDLTVEVSSESPLVCDHGLLIPIPTTTGTHRFTLTYSWN